MNTAANFLLPGVLTAGALALGKTALDYGSAPQAPSPGTPAPEITRGAANVVGLGLVGGGVLAMGSGAWVTAIRVADCFDVGYSWGSPGIARLQGALFGTLAIGATVLAGQHVIGAAANWLKDAN
jgi:hypothetical protein